MKQSPIMISRDIVVTLTWWSSVVVSRLPATLTSIGSASSPSTGVGCTLVPNLALNREDVLLTLGLLSSAPSFASVSSAEVDRRRRRFFFRLLDLCDFRFSTEMDVVRDSDNVTAL